MESAPPPLSRPELPQGIDRPPLEPTSSGLRAVPIWASIVVLVLGVVASVVVGTLVAVGYGVAGEEIDSSEPPDLLVILGTIGQDAGWIALAFLAVRMSVVAGPVADRLGLRGTTWGKALGWGLLVYVVFWVSAGLISAVLGTPETEQGLVEDLKAEDSLAVLAAYAFVATIVAPLGEEILFRGLMYGTLRTRVGVPVAALITGVLFGIIHFDAPVQGILLLCVLGVGLCLLYEATGSLLPCLGLHALHNAITFGATKGMPWYSFIGLMAASTMVVVGVAMALAQRRAAPA